MPRKKSCPVGLICVDTKYLIILLLLCILILVYFVYTNDNDKINKNFIKNTKKVKINDIPVKKSNKYSQLTPRSDLNNTYQDNNSYSESDIVIENDVYDNTNDNKNKQPVIINYIPQTKSDYVVNKDYERIINPLIPPERRNIYIDNNPYERVSGGIPINVPTRGYSGAAVQVGALYKENIDDDTSKIGNSSETTILPLFGNPVHNGSNKWVYYTSSDKFNQVKLPLTNKNKVCSSEYGCDELYENDIVTVPAYNGNFKVVKYEFDKPRYLPHII